MTSNILSNLQSCKECPLYENGFAVPGDGNRHAAIMLIGEAPGAQENLVLKPFVGAAGKFLDELLSLSGLDRADLYVTNAVKHWPGEGNPNPNLDTIRRCNHWLMDEIRDINPSVIICLGASAAHAVLGKAGNLSKEHGIGREIEIEGEVRVVYTLYHPAASMHNPALKATIIDDFKKLGTAIAKPSTVELREYIPQLDPHLPLAIDLETTSLDVYTNKIIAVSMTQEYGKGYVVQWSTELLEILNTFISGGGQVVAHNAAFDLPILQRYGVHINWLNFWDTMLSGYVLGNSLSLKLRALKEHHIVMETYNDVGEGETDASKIPWERLAPYAAVDSEQTLKFFYEDREEVRKRKLTKVMETEHRLVPLLIEMRERGVLIDRRKAFKLRNELITDIERKKNEIYDLVGEFDIDSGDQLAEIMFSHLELKPMKQTKKKTRWAVDKEVMVALEHEHELPRLILDYRELAKLKSTNVDGIVSRLDNKDRIHVTLKQTGASTFRFSAENPNYQNQPSRNLKWKKAIRGLFKAAPGKLLIAADYGQLELRVAAALSQDKKMLEIFNNDGDIHRETTRTILHSETDTSPTGTNLRTLAKNINFGSLYGLSGAGLQRYLAQSDPPFIVSLREATDIVEGLRRAYPGYMEWVTRTIEFVKTHGYAETLMGRRKVYLISDVDDTTKEWVNMPIQGTAGGDVVRDAMVELGRLGFPLIINVHDELVCEVDESIARLAVDDMCSIMVERAEKLLGVNVKAEGKVGKNWGEMYDAD